MFDKVKQIKQLIDLQSQMAKEKVSVEREGVKVISNGKMELESIELNPGLPIKEQEKIVKDCVNEAIKKVQARMAQKMMQTPGFGL